MTSFTAVDIIDHFDEECEHVHQKVCSEAFDDLITENMFVFNYLFSAVRTAIGSDERVLLEPAEYLKSLRSVSKRDRYELFERIMWKMYLYLTDEHGCCLDCYGDTSDEYYMVHNHIWGESGLDTDSGYLCIGCLELRLGRQVTAEDFIDAPINSLGNEDMSERMRNRLEMSVSS